MKCSFCGNNIKPATGKMLIQTYGKILYYCSMKCEKNMLKLRKKARELKWTKHYQKGE